MVVVLSVLKRYSRILIGTREVLEDSYRYSRGTRPSDRGSSAHTDRHEDYFYGNKVVMTGSDVGGFTCRCEKSPPNGVPHIAL